MKAQIARFAVGSVAGAVAIAAAVFYFAWVYSLADPVDWTRTLQLALTIGPWFGWIGGAAWTIYAGAQR